MFLAPLNYDRFFKKVFAEPRIARCFLEDFLDVKIDEIQPLPNYHKLTDQALGVEFDFRCKIQGQYVIVEMQQWRRPDSVKRFYLYNCLNTALQLDGTLLSGFEAGKTSDTEGGAVKF